jgi:hypothetical protein
VSAADLCLALALSALLSVVVAAAQYMRAEKAEAEVERLTDRGLRELGKALGLGLGVQITGPAALVEVERLTAERDALAAQVAACRVAGWAVGAPGGHGDQRQRCERWKPPATLQ